MDCFTFKTDTGSLVVYRSVCQYLNSNMYVLLTESEAVVFDPCEDGELLQLLDSKHIAKVQILLTHEHYDHISGVDWLLENIDAEIFCQKDAAKALAIGRTRTPALISTVLANEDRKDGGHRYPDFKAKFKPYSILADCTFEEYLEFEIGDLRFRAKSTPGHSPGSTCYELNNDIVFTGDTLLQFDPIIIRFVDSKMNEYEDVTLPYLRSLKKTMIVMPGHGDPFLLKDTKNVD